MESSLQHALTTINHSRDKRLYFSTLLQNNPVLIEEVIMFCGDIDDPISYKASWALEFLCKTHLEFLLPHLDTFTQLLPTIYQHSAVRPMAKICEYLCIHYYKIATPAVTSKLTVQHREKISEHCFDWLITPQKVAAKAYAMTCLHLLGNEFEWIHPELKVILEQQYPKESAAYKARAKKILKNI